MRAQHLLHLLGMNLYASAIDDIVLPADDAEAAAVGMKLCAVVGDQPLGTHARGIDNQAALAVERNADVGKGGVEASPVPSEGETSPNPSEGGGIGMRDESFGMRDWNLPLSPPEGKGTEIP